MHFSQSGRLTAEEAVTSELHQMGEPVAVALNAFEAEGDVAQLAPPGAPEVAHGLLEAAVAEVEEEVLKEHRQDSDDHIWLVSRDAGLRERLAEDLFRLLEMTGGPHGELFDLPHR